MSARDQVPVTFTEEEILFLVQRAGFKVFGDKIVAADNGQSGLATRSVRRLIAEVEYRFLSRSANG